MISDDTYELCRPVLDDDVLDDDEKTEKLEELLKEKSKLSGKQLENTILDALWRKRSEKGSGTSEIGSSPAHIRAQHIVRRSSPAPWPMARSATPTHGMGLGAASPALTRTKSSTASPFTSPRASPRLAHVALHSTQHIPHSPRLDAYTPSDVSERNHYADLDGGDVDWLVNDDAASPASSFTGEASLNGGAAEWIGAQAMDPYDMLRSIVKRDLSDEDLERLLQENGYDFSATIMALMDSSASDAAGAMPTPPVTLAEPATQGAFLVGKNMNMSVRPSTPLGSAKSHILCKYYLANGSCARADCRFSHDASKVLCKYFLNGSCLAGPSCIFSHDASLLLQRMTLEHNNLLPLQYQMANQMMSQQPNFQLSDYDAFPTLQQPNIAISNFPTLNASGYDWDAFEKHNGSIGAVAPPPGFNPLMGHIPNGPSSRGGSRPSSRHASRAPTPSVPAVDDAEAFPSLGSAAKGSAKKHHGKRGGHGHAAKESPATLADLVRMSPSPSPQLRKTFQKTTRGYLSRETSSSAMSIPAPENIPWLETGDAANKAYLKARAEAIKHGGLRNKFLQSAAQAYNRNDSRAAKALSLRGQSENNLMREAHREAAKALYEERNQGGAGGREIYVDLHGLHPEEAVNYLLKALNEHRSTYPSKPIYAITGTGHHSRNGKDKIGKAVKTFLVERGYVHREFSVPGDRNSMGGIIGIDPSSGGKSTAPDGLGGAEGGGSGGASGGESTKVRILRKEDMEAEAEEARARNEADAADS